MGKEIMDFAESISKFCYNSFRELPKTGKPNINEWTVLSCIVKSSDASNHELVSLGTGSKCIGKQKMSPDGDILNDSHAEVMARRGFLRYLYDQVDSAYKSETSIFVLNCDFKCRLKDDIQFHFFSSQCPCGDASIIENVSESSEDYFHSTETFDKSKKRKNWDLSVGLWKKGKTENRSFIHMTGAKNIQYPKDDDKVLGQVRRKPGKGDPTASLSCSDKIARWIRVGIQGALLDMLLEKPLTINSITIGAGFPFSKGAFYRTLVDRTFTSTYTDEWNVLRNTHRPGDLDRNNNLLTVPAVEQSTVKFEFSKEEGKQPCASSIVWCRVSNVPLEVAVAGRKQGSTKKNVGQFSSSLLISKRHLFETFLVIVKSSVFPKKLLVLPEVITYKKVKNMSERYNHRWNYVKHNFFNVWSDKPDKLDFSL